MEQTIGKRIMVLRKSRGMTQTQLADLLGISAQAVSKWENDTSCPDITLLPKLAEIFQVTTDSLLGMPEQTEIVPAPPTKHSVHESIVDEEPEEEEEEEEENEEKSGFTLQFDIGTFELPWFAILVLVFAVCLLLNRTLLAPLGETSIWNLLWPTALFITGLSSLFGSINLGSIGMTCFGGYCLLVNMHILPRWHGFSWKIAIPVLLILWAINLIADHFRSKDHRSGSHQAAQWEFNNQEGAISLNCSFGSESIAVTDPIFRGGNVETSFGSYTLDLTACQTVEPGSRLIVNLSFGSLTLKLPPHWNVQEQSDRSFSSLTTHGSPAPDADQLLILESDLSFGTLDLQW